MPAWKPTHCPLYDSEPSQHSLHWFGDIGQIVLIWTKSVKLGLCNATAVLPVPTKALFCIRRRRW